MSSADSPGNSHNNGSSCSLVSSLFPTSCRGRAEAFARSLHRRLTSLGAEPEDLSQPSEATWLGTAPAIKTTEPTSSNRPRHLADGPYHEPQPEPDEQDQRPDEELRDAERRLSDSDEMLSCVERTQSSESSSEEPSQAEAYFDLASPDPEKPPEVFFDPVSTSESDTSARIAPRVNGLTPDSDRPFTLEQSPQTKSSTDTTSPSHESLWSDDSTISIPEDSSPEREREFETGASKLPRSFSDSNIFVSVTQRRKVFSVVCVESSLAFSRINRRASESDLSSSVEPEDQVMVSSRTSLQKFPRDTSGDFVEDGSGRDTVCADKLTKLLESLKGSYTDKTEMRMQDLDTLPNQDLDTLPNQELDIPPNQFLDIPPNQELDTLPAHREDDDEDDHPPPRVRRCSSLKSGKTPPSTPCRKKIVRFADVLGLDLADVRTFLDEIPKVPNSAYSDLIYDEAFQKDSSPVQCWNLKYSESTTTIGASQSLPIQEKILVPMFQQPGGLSNFLDMVREKFVCLENASVLDPIMFCVQGTVRVLNLDFHKSVHIRYTLNSWTNYSDLQATYVPNSCDGLSDKFSFLLYCHTLGVGQRLEFAVRFQCKGAQYWDNNKGVNYCFQCMSTAAYESQIAKSVSGHTRQWEATFY